MRKFVAQSIGVSGVIALALAAPGCEPPKVSSRPSAGPPPPPAAPVPPTPGSAAGAGVVFAEEDPGSVLVQPIASTPEASIDESATGERSSAASLTAALSPEEAAVHALFRENMELARSTDGKRILARCHPALRSYVILGMAQMGYLMLGPDSEAGRIVASAGLLAEKYKPLFDDLNDRKIESPASQALLDEAAGKIRDPERLVTLVREATVSRMPEAKYELVNLTVSGDQAAGVCLMVTRVGTQAVAFAAEKIDGTWYATEPTAAAEAKVQQYNANPTPATIKLLPRNQVRVAAAELAAEFQNNPTGAAQKYGSPFGSMGPIGPAGPFGGPPGPFAGAPERGSPMGVVVQPPTLPMPRDHDIVLAGTVAFRMSINSQPVVYLVTPAGAPAVNMTVQRSSDLAPLLAAAEPGQSVEAIVDAAVLTTLPMSGPGTISVASGQIQIRGAAAEPLGPIAAADLFRELSDPAAVAKYQGQPVIVTGAAVMSQSRTLMLGLGNGQGGMVGCVLLDSEGKKLQAVKRGQELRVQGTFIQPQGRNQVMLFGSVLVSGP